MKFKCIFFCVILAAGAGFTGCSKGETDPSTPGYLVPLTVDQDPLLPNIQVNGTQLHAEAFGSPDSSLLVVLHGGPGSDYRYLLNCRAFADHGFRVIFYDQRGSGLSRRHPKASYSDIDIMLEDLTAVVDHYRTHPGQKVFLLGHSWGAMLATSYINRYPDRIHGAILCEPGGFTYAQMKEYVDRSRQFPALSEAFNDVMFPDQLLTGSADDQAILDYKLGLQQISTATADNPIGNEGLVPFWRNGAVVSDALFTLAEKQGFDWTTHLGQFTTKVLFLYSANNKAYGEIHARKVSAPYPNVQLVRIDRTGHDMLTFSQGWSQFLPIALSYLNALK